MNQSLSTFMVMAIVTIIMSSLVIGIVFSSLDQKNEHHVDMLETEHQIKLK